MKRIDSYGAASGNLFTSGDPAAGIPATRLSSDYMNVLQEEIAGVVEGAGLTLDQGTTFEAGHDTTQLHDAIVAIVNSTVAGLTTVPVGGIIPFAGPVANIPSGWLHCDGSLVSRTTYAALFAKIGTAWGTSGSSDFRVPDLRGYFLRGQDESQGVDSNASLRTAKFAGGNTGDAVGTYQTDLVGSHTHGVTIALAGNSAATSTPPAASNGTTVGVNYTGNTAANTGAETRPKNASVVYIIRSGI